MNGRMFGIVMMGLALGSAAFAVEVPEGSLAIFKISSLPKVAENPDNPTTPEKVALGRMLYYDARFSKAQDISCNTCHPLDKYGVDSKPVSPGHKAQTGTRNSPTVYNTAIHLAQFWDGRAKNVEEQALKPVLNPVEMAMPSEATVVDVLKSIPGYNEAFKKAFPGQPDAVTCENFGKAIGVFERGLMTPSPWDKFLAGDEGALTDDQKAGFNEFFNAQCFVCHMGSHLGGMMYQKLGLIMPWPNQKDQGKFEVTKAEADKMMFKVPTLRNIAKTAPYFHDGSQPSLPEAVKMMAWHQSAKKLTDAQAKSIATFLESLTGEIPQDYIKKPELPPSGPKTPKPSTD